MVTPKLYLIRSGLTDAEAEQVRNTLALTPLTGVFVYNPEDAALARKISEAPLMQHSMMAVFGKFHASLSVVNDDGSVEELSLQPPQFE